MSGKEETDTTHVASTSIIGQPISQDSASPPESHVSSKLRVDAVLTQNRAAARVHNSVTPADPVINLPPRATHIAEIRGPEAASEPAVEPEAFFYNFDIADNFARPLWQGSDHASVALPVENIPRQNVNVEPWQDHFVFDNYLAMFGEYFPNAAPGQTAEHGSSSNLNPPHLDFSPFFRSSELVDDTMTKAADAIKTGPGSSTSASRTSAEAIPPLNHGLHARPRSPRVELEVDQEWPDAWDPVLQDAEMRRAQEVEVGEGKLFCLRAGEPC